MARANRVRGGGGEGGKFHITGRDQMKREPCWTESLAVGSAGFVEKIKPQILSRRDMAISEQGEERWVLQEAVGPGYGQKRGSKSPAKPAP